MANFSVADADNYGGQGGGGFFRLENDKDVAQVRFLYTGIEDVMGYSVHEVEVDGKKRYVNCLREYGDPVDVCPFCAAQKFVQVKYFIPLYNMDADCIQTWERGKKFGGKISSIVSRYPNTVSHIFEIERNGKPKDTQTTYEIYETGEDDTTIDQFEDIPDPLGTIILNKSAEEMEEFLENDTFGDEAPVRRESRATRQPQQPDKGGITRRTPTGNNGGRRKAF